MQKCVPLRLGEATGSVKSNVCVEKISVGFTFFSVIEIPYPGMPDGVSIFPVKSSSVAFKVNLETLPVAGS
jgi:hypothetical protein